MKVQILFLVLGMYASNAIAVPNCELQPYENGAISSTKKYFATSKSEQTVAFSPSAKKATDVSEIAFEDAEKKLSADSVIFSFQSSDVGPMVMVTKGDIKDLLKGNDDDVKIWLDPTNNGLIALPSLNVAIWCGKAK